MFYDKGGVRRSAHGGTALQGERTGFMKISACWITKNEESNIPASIESVREAVDEMVVVDTGSTDNTVEAARSLGARVERFEWTADFSAARNYALSLADGDYIIFLDADERFNPKLGQGDRDVFGQCFDNYPNADVLSVQISNFDNDNNRLIRTLDIARIFRGKGRVIYKKRIHESLTRSDGQYPNTLKIPGYNVDHSGYSASIFPQKLDRNISLLEETLANSTDPVEICSTHGYLMRDYQGRGRYAEAFDHMMESLKMEREFDICCTIYSTNFVERIYMSMELCHRFRERSSRRFVREKIVPRMQRFFPAYNGTPMVNLYYQYLFELRDDVFLTELDRALEVVADIPPNTVSQYRGIQCTLLEYAALAAWRRGERMRAFDYAVAAFNLREHQNARTLHLLLSCIRGQPAKDTVLFLGSLFDVARPQTLAFLVKNLQVEGFKDVWMFFLKKQIDAGAALKGDFLYLLLCTGNIENAVASAQEMYDEKNADAVLNNLLIAALLSGDRSIYDNNKELLAPVQEVLQHYYDDTPIPQPSNAMLTVLRVIYPMLAFAGGIEAADRFLRLYSSVPGEQFLAKAPYLLQCEAYAAIIEDGCRKVTPGDWPGNEYLVQSHLALKQYGRALSILEGLLGQDIMPDTLFQYLLVVVENGAPEEKKHAGQLFDKYYTYASELRDLRDVVNTHFAYELTSKKDRRALRRITLEDVKKRLAAAGRAHMTRELLDVLEKAADIYEAEKMPAMVIECCVRMLAFDYKIPENYARLGDAFMRFENKQLAGQLEALSLRARA